MQSDSRMLRDFFGRAGLLRAYFPKGTNCKPITQARLDAVAADLNGRPRMT